MDKMRPSDELSESAVEGKVSPPKVLSSSWLRGLFLKVETHGIQRVTEEERNQNTTKVWNACTFWYVILKLRAESGIDFA